MVLISHRHRCIFIHIPKTGGDSIESVIWPGDRTAVELFGMPNLHQTGGLQHLLARQVREEVGDAIFDGYFRFSFVRNPWDRVVSQYTYMRQRPDLRALIGMRRKASLGEYLELTAQKPHVQWAPQLDFLRDAHGHILVDYIGHFERLADDMAVVFARIGLVGAALPHRNASRRATSYRGYYDATTRDIVAARFAGDIDAFGYEF